MIKTTRWKPDTCGCVIHYQWDSEATPETRTFSVVEQIPCPAHAGLPDMQAQYDAVCGENGRKNQFLAGALEGISQLRETTADGAVVLKNGVSFNWSWDQSRVLHVSFSGISLSAQQRNTLQTIADNRFGPGNVVVD